MELKIHLKFLYEVLFKNKEQNYILIVLIFLFQIYAQKVSMIKRSNTYQFKFETILGSFFYFDNNLLIFYKLGLNKRLIIILFASHIILIDYKNNK